MEEEKVEEMCLSCKVSSAAGLMIGQYCKADKDGCESIANEFSEGNMTLKQLAGVLEVEPDFLAILEEEGVPLDVTLAELIKKEAVSDEQQVKTCKVVSPSTYEKKGGD